MRVIPEPSLLYPLPCRLCTLTEIFKCRSSLEKHVFIAFDSATDKLILQHESFIYQMNSWTYVAAVKASKKIMVSPITNDINIFLSRYSFRRSLLFLSDM